MHLNKCCGNCCVKMLILTDNNCVIMVYDVESRARCFSRYAKQLGQQETCDLLVTCLCPNINVM